MNTSAAAEGASVGSSSVLAPPPAPPLAPATTTPPSATEVEAPRASESSSSTTTTAQYRSRIITRLKKLRALPLPFFARSIRDEDVNSDDDGVEGVPLLDTSTAAHVRGDSGGSGRDGSDEASQPICLICQEVLTAEEFEAGEAISLQCACRGEMAMRHRKCAIEWSHHKGDLECDICKQPIANLPPIPPEMLAAREAATIRASGALSPRTILWNLARDCVCTFWIVTFASMLLFQVSFGQAETIGLALSGSVTVLCMLSLLVVRCTMQMVESAAARRRAEDQRLEAQQQGARQQDPQVAQQQGTAGQQQERGQEQRPGSDPAATVLEPGVAGRGGVEGGSAQGGDEGSTGGGEGLGLGGSGAGVAREREGGAGDAGLGVLGRSRSATPLGVTEGSELVRPLLCGEEAV